MYDDFEKKSTNQDDSLEILSSIYESAVQTGTGLLRTDETQIRTYKNQQTKNIGKNSKKKKGKKARKQLTSPSETPGNPNIKEESEQFNHQYYQASIKMMNMLLFGKDKLPEQYSHQKIEVKLDNVFYEEPLDNDNFLQKSLNMQPRKDQEWRKQMEKRKYMELTQEGNDQEQLYLINAIWVKNWITYLTLPSADLPGQIMNDNLYYKIEAKKKIYIGDDLFVISQKLWNAYFDWYSGGPTLKWKIEPDNHSPAETSNRPDQLMPEKSADYSQKINQSQEEDNKYDFTKLSNKKTQNGNINNKGPSILSPGSDISDLRRGVTGIYKPNYEELDYSVTKGGPDEDSESGDNETPRVQKSFRKNDKQLRIFGLENNRLFCYLNSVLQCLFAVPEFRKYYLKSEYKKLKVKNPMARGLKFSTFMTNFSEEIDKVTSSKSNLKVIKTSKLKSIIQSEFSPVQEHDSHEFLLYFLNNLKDEITEKGAKLPNTTNDLNKLWKEFAKIFPSQIDLLFTVIEKTQVQCGSCKRDTDSLQYYLSFPLQVEGLKNINESLKHHQQEEALNDYKCDYCKKKSNCKLRRKIMKVPDVFIFQLQRFSMYPRMRKIRGQIGYSEYLDMDKFIDPQFSKEKCNQPLLYQLIAVAVHLGSINGGHYVAYAKKEDEAWYYMDDERVSKNTMSNNYVSITPGHTPDKEQDEQPILVDQNEQPQEKLEKDSVTPDLQDVSDYDQQNSFITPGGGFEFENEFPNESEMELTVEQEKIRAQQDYARKMRQRQQQQQANYDNMFSGMNNDDEVQHYIRGVEYNNTPHGSSQFFNDMSPRIGLPFLNYNQSINYDMLNFEEENIMQEQFIRNYNHNHINNLIYQQNVMIDEQELGIKQQEFIFEQMQPQQIDHENSVQNNKNQLFYEENLETLGGDDLQNESDQIDELLSQNTRKRKKRGAPFKGQVSDNKEEGFKVQRQQELREFKSFYEKRSYLRRFSKSTPKKKRVFANHEDLEQEQRQITQQDADLLFSKSLFPFVTDETNRHYNKISGNFDLIREPMYKYRKEVKERLFKDNVMAFYWMYYRCLADFQYLHNNNQLITIMQSFDVMALETLQNGNQYLYAFIIQMMNTSIEIETIGREETSIILEENDQTVENLSTSGNVSQVEEKHLII